MKVVVVGAGVIGSVYGARLIQSGHDVTFLARGKRLADLQTCGLVVDDVDSGRREEMSPHIVSELSANEAYDLALVPVRTEQLASTLPVLLEMRASPDVLFLGNTTGHQAELTNALGKRAVFGFPAIGGSRDGVIVKYVVINRQRTTLGEASGVTTSRINRLGALLGDAGFPTNVSTNIAGWMLGHSAFVVPIGFALYRCDTNPTHLAGDARTLRLMVQATRDAFKALDHLEIPANLRWLYLRMPTAFAIWYWRQVFGSPRGELWFAAHCRAAPGEMHALAGELRIAVERIGRPTPSLDRLVGNG